MDSNILVNGETYIGRNFISQLNFNEYEFIGAAWVKQIEDEAWRLYIVTPLVERQGTSEAYSQLQDSLNRIGDALLTLSDITLVGTDDRVGKDILAVVHNPNRITGPLGETQRRGGRFGDVSFSEAYIYPRSHRISQGPGAVARNEILNELVRLMNQSSPMPEVAMVALVDGSRFCGVPFSLQVGSDRAIVVQFIVAGELVPRIVHAGDITSIA